MILVTGSTGHLGANLVRRLLADGEEVRVLLREGSRTRAVHGLDVERTFGDLRDPMAVRDAMRGCRRVYHCAAKISISDVHHREIYDSNVLATRHVLRAALEVGVSRVVVTSSLGAVGHDRDRAVDETLPANPFDRLLPYERAKVAVEHDCLKAVVDGLDVVIATVSAILGPNDFVPSRMGQVLIDFARGRLRAYVPGGLEWIAARDAVEGHLLAMNKGRRGQKYLFSTEFSRMDDLMGVFERVTGRRRPRLRLPVGFMAGIAGMTGFVGRRLFPTRERRFTPSAVRHLRLGRRADIAKACHELGYAPTSLARAIEEQHEFFVRQGWIAVTPSPRITR
jgi:nucleoside-diphosphate-sugar epimerase